MRRKSLFTSRSSFKVAKTPFSVEGWYRSYTQVGRGGKSPSFFFFLRLFF